MALTKAKAEHIDGIAFKGVSGSNHNFIMDSTNKESLGQNKGASPKEVLLGSLCACTGMDVVSIMTKMKIPYTHFEVTAEAEQTEDHPKVFKSILLKYKVSGDNLDREKILHAIDLSKTKYCGISAMLSKACQINFELEINK